MHRPDAHSGVTNRLLLAMPPASLQRLWPSLEPVETMRGEVLSHLDRRVRFVYFINRGLVSLVKTMEDGRAIEIGAIGIEGVTNVMALFGDGRAVMEAVVQVPGAAFRMKVETLRAAMQADPALNDMLQRYIRFSYHQLAQTAACNQLHTLEQRCCRWLLIAHDSACSDTFVLTHEFLAMMLGVRRAGVTVAANALKKSGLIRYTHGLMTVTDRGGLEAAACECYRAVESELEVMFHARLLTCALRVV